MTRIRGLEALQGQPAGTAGTVEASKAPTVDSNKDIGDFRNLSATNLKAGKDAVAGSVTIFPATTAKGKTVFSATDNTGNTTTSIVTAAMAAARTLTIPDPGAAASFLMTQGAQTISGITTFDAMFRIPHATLAAAGTNLANAAQLVTGLTTVTAADGTKGVKLPATPTAGDIVVVKNNSASALKVYPDAAATINAIGSNAEISLAARTTAIFFADSATQWWTLPLLPS